MAKSKDVFGWPVLTIAMDGLNNFNSLADGLSDEFIVTSLRDLRIMPLVTGPGAPGRLRTIGVNPNFTSRE